MATSLFEKIRKKQRRRLAVKISSITAFLILFMSLAIIYRSKQDNAPVDTHQDKSNPIVRDTIKVCLSPAISAENSERIKQTQWSFEDSKTEITSGGINDLGCNILLVRNIEDTDNYQEVWNRLFVLVGRFDSDISKISNEDFIKIVSSRELSKKPVIWDTETDEFIKSKYSTVGGTIYTESSQVERKLVEDPDVYAIIPFENLNPLFKVIKIDDNSPYDRDGFNPTLYPLLDTLWIRGENRNAVLSFKSEVEQLLLEENYNRDGLKNIILTGTSALGARGQQSIVAQEGDDLFPARGLVNLISSADIAHISNESPFDDSCVQASFSQLFCGKPANAEMLDLLGVDIVGVTGNHVLDYGEDAFQSTLETYEKKGLKYFGGGKNREDAHTPAILQLGDIKVGFLGYNLLTPYTYYAYSSKPGNTSPDSTAFSNDKKLMKEDIDALKKKVDFVILDMQWGEQFSSVPNAQQIDYARAAIDYGVDIVNGVGSFTPQAMEYYKDGVIFYGLGNFLFDPPSREAYGDGIAVKHIFYKGKHIGIEIIPLEVPANLQTVVAEGPEAKQILNKVFENSTINIR